MAFDNFYRHLARNGFAHSAYVIHEGEYRVHYLAHDRYDNSAVFVAETLTLSDLRSGIAHAIAFYEPFFDLEQGARKPMICTILPRISDIVLCLLLALFGEDNIHACVLSDSGPRRWPLIAASKLFWPCD